MGIWPQTLRNRVKSTFLRGQIQKKSGQKVANWPNLAKSVQKNRPEFQNFWPKSGQWPNPKTQKWPQKESRQTIFTSLSGQFRDHRTINQVRYPRFS